MAWKVGTVALVLVDEVHTIGEERGATLEVILTRMKLVSRSPEVRLRAFVHPKIQTSRTLMGLFYSATMAQTATASSGNSGKGVIKPRGIWKSTRLAHEA